MGPGWDKDGGQGERGQEGCRRRGPEGGLGLASEGEDGEREAAATGERPGATGERPEHRRARARVRPEGGTRDPSRRRDMERQCWRVREGLLGWANLS